MDEDLEKFEELIRNFADAEFELKNKVRKFMLGNGVTARVADMAIVNGSVRNLSWLLNAVIGQMVGDAAPSEKTMERGNEIYTKLGLMIRDMISEYSDSPVVFLSVDKKEEDDEEKEESDESER